MDASRFDNLIRSLTARSSRRGLLRGLLVAVTGGAVGMVDLAQNPDTAAAKQCPPCRKRKRGKCRRKRPDGTPCGEGKTCQQGVCATCIPNFEFCTQTPVDRCCSGHCENVQPDIFICTPAP